MLGDNSDLLNRIGDFYKKRLKENLKADGNYATGELENSIQYRLEGNSVIITTEGKDWRALASISEGRKPSNKLPSKEMVSRIVLWMKAKGMQPMVRRTAKEGRSVNGVKLKDRGGRLRKNSESVFRKAAFSIGMSILHKGYRGSQVIERSYRQIESKITKEVLDSFSVKIDNELNRIIIK